MIERNPTNSEQSSSKSSQQNPAATKSNSIEVPQITLPKGGGAIKSIDEKFSVNAANGTSGFSIPLPFSKSRNDFMPSVSLSYKSGGGNSAFGLGWNIDIPSISRKTEKELPRYEDGIESDTFLFTGVEDLVPALKDDGSGNWSEDILTTGTKVIKLYRPRIEGSYARIEKINDNGDVYWRVTTKENVTSVFGKSDEARIFDPSNPQKIFKWMLEFSYDDKGNCFQFDYKKENQDISNSLHERNRLNSLSNFSNTYLKKIKYCNKKHFRKTGFNISTWNKKSVDYLLELVLDYGEHSVSVPLPDDWGVWEWRKDPFSDYRAGFEIRTYRLCKRILMFHNFTEGDFRPPAGNNLIHYLVRSMNFYYDETTEFTFLESIVQKGHIRQLDGTYTSKDLPPLTFDYEKLGWNTDVKFISQENIMHAPVGLDDRNYQWIDLYGEGISGILTEQSNAIFYKSNLGDGEFTAAKLVSPKPSLSGLSSGALQFQELEANGKKFLVSQDNNGYFEFTENDEWLPFANFQNNPNINFGDPNVKFLDLNGDGLADLLISEDNVFTWYPSKGKDGFDNSAVVRKSFDEEEGPNVVFADSTQSIVLTDMSGDGMTDIVRIRNGEIVYWPNLGYGRFGAKVSMSNAPVFDHPENFNPAFIKMGDIDGTGSTDIVYFGKDSFKIYFNQSGNSWSEENIIKGVNPLPFPKTDQYKNISVIDLLGTGTSCIVWSSPLPSDANMPLRYIDLMGGKKPHIMIGYKNNLGKEITLEYKPSTYFYLKDKQAGKKWITKLPFPVQCVSKVFIKDRISKVRYANLYEYHHGYYDYAEKEFRGFGMVEQTDTDTYAEGTPDQHPVTTKTWYHTGAYFDRNRILNQFENEYYNNTEKKLIDPHLHAGLNAQECREALRACKGMPLRIEIYSFDGSVENDYPYSSAQHSCMINLVQPQKDNKHAVFSVIEREALTYYYERNPADPRISHTMNIDVDEYGNVRESAAIVYGRIGTVDDAEQSKVFITYTLNKFTKDIVTNSDYFLRVLCETETYELNINPNAPIYFEAGEVGNKFSAMEIPYQSSISFQRKRKIEHIKTLFIKNDLSGSLTLGDIEIPVLPYESYQLAFTESLVTSATDYKVNGTMLISEGNYIEKFGPDLFGSKQYWIPSGLQVYDSSNFYQVKKITDPFGNDFELNYDTKYHLYIEKTKDPKDNKTQVLEFNYRTLLPYLSKDMNNNLSGVRFDELGLVTKIFVMGKDNTEGDRMNINSVEEHANDHSSVELIYNITKWYDKSNSPGFDPDAGYYKAEPNFVETKAYEEHFNDNATAKFQLSRSYSDGSGNEIMKKIQAEDGKAPKRDAAGKLEKNASGNLILAHCSDRWVGTGRTILNNKGKPVKQYEPFFSSTSEFEDEVELVEVGVTPVIHYDPLDRVIRTDFPDGTFSKVEFNPWKQITYDQNDTVRDVQCQWYRDRGRPDPTAAEPTGPENRAAWLAAHHYDTPTVSYLDSLGRVFLTIADNGIDGKYKTRIELDIEGNQRKVLDHFGRPVMEYIYSMLGNLCKQISMDAGTRIMFNDVAGKPVKSWDDRLHEFEYEYDELQRPLKKFVTTGGSTKKCFEWINYGEDIINPELKNLRGKVHELYDTAGKIQNEEFDFKGNLLKSSRKFLINYKDEPRWDIWDDTKLGVDTFTTETLFDALNRPVKITSPDGSITAPVYNKANLLNEVKVTVKTNPETSYVKNIDYDAKGQREKIVYGNDVETTYQYDDKTFRLKHLMTKNNSGGKLQDLSYTYDPVGNITQIKDIAQQIHFYRNARVAPVNKYEYDAIYCLKKANGREHIGQNKIDTYDNWQDEFFTNIPHKGDGNAMRNYTQEYKYDEVGNMKTLIHNFSLPGNYTRDYTYDSNNNHLLQTSVGSRPVDKYDYSYDTHGNIDSMDHLSAMEWDFKDQLHMTQQTASLTGEKTYYVYDSSGQRVRKITERQGTGTPRKKEERFYLSGSEVYRSYDIDGSTIKLERETLYVADDKRKIALVETKTTDPGSTDTTTLNIPYIRYQHDNHLGSACLELDDAAKIISYEEYHPYGTTAYQAVSGINPEAKRYRYTGMERDEESGFEYHSARYYLPWLGRWLSADPIGIRGGINLYCYSKNDPILLSDKLGNQPTCNESLFNDSLDQAINETEGTNDNSDEIRARARQICAEKSEQALESEPTQEETEKPTLFGKVKGFFGYLYGSAKESLKETISQNVSSAVASITPINMDSRDLQVRMGEVTGEVAVELGQEMAINAAENAATGGVASILRRVKVRKLLRLTEGKGGTKQHVAYRNSGTEHLSPEERRDIYKRRVEEGGIPRPKRNLCPDSGVVKNADGSTTYTLNNGMKLTYNADGFPDFTPYLHPKNLNRSVVINLNNRRADAEAANRVLGFSSTPEGYVWHHNERVGVMQLVRKDIHDAFKHAGGFTVYDKFYY